MHHIPTKQADQNIWAGTSREKSGFLTLSEIAQLVAQAVLSLHQDKATAHSSWVYATDRDKFLDLHAYQSVNTNRSK
jgi:hypothetical protein